MREYKIAYIEGRPSGHPIHTAYAESLNCTFHHVDFKLRYHDIPEASALKRYLSWIVCAFTFPNKNKYDVFLSEEAYFMLGIMKKMRLISKKQKLIALMSSHTLYFLYTNQYPKSTKKAFLQLFKLYDAFICIGPIQFELMTNFLGNNSKVKVYQIFNGIAANRFNDLIKITPNLDKLNIITIGAISNQTRIHYKGLDLMLAAFTNIKPNFPNLTFTIVGDYDNDLIETLVTKYCPKYKQDIVFTGQSTDICNYLKEACLYLHTARGEAWGISVTEAMAAGVTPIVSEWTGSKEAVEKVSEELIVQLNSDKIAEKINWYLNLPFSEKQKLSKKCKQIASFYTEKNSIDNFKIIFNTAVEESASY